MHAEILLRQDDFGRAWCYYANTNHSYWQLKSMAFEVAKLPPPPEAMPLIQLAVGEHARIAEIRGGRQLTRRLLSLGLRVGMELDVLHRRGRGVVVGSSGTRVALGAGVAEKLYVTPVA